MQLPVRALSDVDRVGRYYSPCRIDRKFKSRPRAFTSGDTKPPTSESELDNGGTIFTTSRPRNLKNVRSSRTCQPAVPHAAVRQFGAVKLPMGEQPLDLGTPRQRAASVR